MRIQSIKARDAARLECELHREIRTLGYPEDQLRSSERPNFTAGREVLVLTECSTQAARKIGVGKSKEHCASRIHSDFPSGWVAPPIEEPLRIRPNYEQCDKIDARSGGKRSLHATIVSVKRTIFAENE